MKATVKRCNTRRTGCKQQAIKVVAQPCVSKSDKGSASMKSVNQCSAPATEPEIQYNAPNVCDVTIEFNFGRPTVCNVECRGVAQTAWGIYEPYFGTIEAALAMGRHIPEEHLANWRVWRKEQNERYACDLVNAAVVLGCDLLRIRYMTTVANVDLQRHLVADFQQRLEVKAKQKGIRVVYPK